MIRYFSLALLAISICANAAPKSARANQITFWDAKGRTATAAETGDMANPVPPGSRVFTFAVSTDSDILAFENIQITTEPPNVPLYNNPWGDATNANKANPALFPVFPSLSADSWFDTPGSTVRLGADLPGDGLTTFGDFDNHGPQNEFVYAQLTFPPTFGRGVLTGRIAINSTTNPGTPYSQDFRIAFPIPETTSASLCGIAALTVAGVRRWTTVCRSTSPSWNCSMMKTFSLLLVASLATSLAPHAVGNQISASIVDIGGRALTPPEVAGGAPAGGRAYTFMVTTDSDILAFENVHVHTIPAELPLYNHPFGDAANANKPNDALIPAFPGLAADSWIDTPGATVRLGSDLPGGGHNAFADLQNNGPQQNFIFAQLTFGREVVNVQLCVRVTINSTTDPDTPFSQDFSMSALLTPGFPPCVPEPAAGFLGLTAAAALACARRAACVFHRRTPQLLRLKDSGNSRNTRPESQ